MTIVWFVLFVTFLVFELATSGLYTIWFSIGALIATLISMAGGPIWVQIVVFFVVSLALLLFTRPIAKRFFNQKRMRTNIEALLENRGTVIETIDNSREQGLIRYNGMPWSARSLDESIIEAGEHVIIKRIEGVKVIVIDEKKL